MKNRSYRTTDEYVVSKEKAKIIDSNMLGRNPCERAREVAAYRRHRPNLERACGHVTFSLPHREDENGNVTYHESLTDDQAIEFVSKWRSEMGVTNCLHFLARHRDTEHEHFHLVFCRIRRDGSVIDDGWDYFRSQPIVRRLEKEFGLEVQVNSWEVGHRAQTKKQKHHSSGELPVTKKLEQLINAATADKPTVTEMIDRLQQQGVIVRPTFSTRALFKKAISFELDGVAIAGNKLGKAYSFPGLQKWLGVDYDPERDMPALKAAAAGELVQKEAEGNEAGSRGEGLLSSTPPAPIEVASAAGEHHRTIDSDNTSDSNESMQQEKFNVPEPEPNSPELSEIIENPSSSQPESVIEAAEQTQTKIDPQQQLWAEVIYPIAQRLFNGELNDKSAKDISTEIQYMDWKGYRLIFYKPLEAFVVEGLDRRNEIFRYVNCKLSSACNISARDVELWNTLEKQLNEQAEPGNRQRREAAIFRELERIPAIVEVGKNPPTESGDTSTAPSNTSGLSKSALEPKESEQSKIDPQQSALAATIFAIAKFVFNTEESQSKIEETPEAYTLTGEYYKLIRYKNPHLAIMEALDGRGELFRYSTGKLLSAQNITQQDLTRWQGVERLFKRKEVEAKSLQQETKPQPIEASGTQQEVERNRQEAERQRLEIERKRQEAERQQLEAERQRQKTERERQRLETERKRQEAER